MLNLANLTVFYFANDPIKELVNEELKNICKSQNTRHRALGNFLINIIAALVSYSFFPKNHPSIFNLKRIMANCTWPLKRYSR